MKAESSKNIIKNPYLIGGMIGGLTQLGFESLAVALKEPYSRLKFPNGFSDLNPSEELLEGSIPAVIGVAAGRYSYRVACRLAGVKPDPDHESIFMMAGGIAGYGGMVTAGFILHPLLGIHDVKWGPFR